MSAHNLVEVTPQAVANTDSGRKVNELMMDTPAPKLCVGLPIYNGEKYLKEALDSILSQTYTDFELVISDNASTDRTQEICLAYAAKDKRIRYHRNPANIGAAGNWYRVLELCASDYFIAAADDDLYHPEYLQRCATVLDQNPEVVLCYTKTTFIDENGDFLRNIDTPVDTVSPKPHVRLYNIIGVEVWAIQMYGVMRTSVLRATKIYTGYFGEDRNILAELALRGLIYEIPEYLFLHRIHARALGAGKNSGRSLQELAQIDPTINWRFVEFSFLTKFRNFFVAVNRVPLGFTERVRCYGQLLRLFVEQLTTRVKYRWQQRRG